MGLRMSGYVFYDEVAPGVFNLALPHNLPEKQQKSPLQLRIANQANQSFLGQLGCPANKWMPTVQ